MNTVFTMTRLVALLLLAAPLLTTTAFADDRTAFTFDQRPGALIPMAAPLRAEDATETTLGTIAQGRPTLLVLGYFHCPNLCGVVRDDVFNALQHTSLDPAAYALDVLTIDPAETPADAATAKAAAIDRYAAAAAAHFITGDTQAITAAAGFRNRYDPASAQFLHPAGLVFLTAQGTVSSYIGGVGYDPADLERAISTASAGVVAATASPILLLCFHFDESTGRYTLAVTKLLRLAGGLTAAGLLAFLLVAHRRSRPRAS